MSVGSWNVDVHVGSELPQKIATAFSELNLVGAEYTPIAYLGSQLVNGTNHAVLAKQLVITGKDTENVVVMIFNEKPGEMKATLVGIERVVESGGELGGIKVDVHTDDIPEEASKAFKTCFEGYVGVKVEPFAYLGSQVTKGVNYIFAAKVTGVVRNPETEVCLVVVNSLTRCVNFVNILGVKNDTASLGYAFTWLN